MKIFITGINGQLGYDVALEALKRNYEVYGCGTTEQPDIPFNYITINITNPEEVKKIKQFYPDVIIHCAAYTNVDAAEDNIELANNINYLGTKYIAELAKEINATMIYISTDYVFNENNEDIIPVAAKEKPLNIYGKTKFKGEIAVSSILNKYYIVRTSWLFGKHGKNFIQTMLNLSANKKEINVVNDQIGRPTYTVDLAKLLIDMAETNHYGYYHATNEGEYISWYHFCKIIFNIKGINTIINPITSNKFNSKAIRPKNSRLDTSKLIKEGFNPLPNYVSAIMRYLNDLD